MSKITVTLEMNGEVKKAEHDGVMVIAIDKADDGGVDISTVGNIPLQAALKALEEAIVKEENNVIN